MPVRPSLHRRRVRALEQARPTQLGRRAFLSHGVLLLAGSNLPWHSELGATTRPADPIGRFGVMTDVHYADKEAGGTRHYRRVPAKLTKAAQQLVPFQPAFVVELGDYIVLDACYRDDEQSYGRQNFDWTHSRIPTEELKWLQHDLARADRPTLVFVHQRLDVGDSYGVKNAAAVREILERSGKVWAVFQGHNHINDYRDIHGIHYVTVQAMVEGANADDNALATVEVFREGGLRVTGFRQQDSYRFGL